MVDRSRGGRRGFAAKLVAVLAAVAVLQFGLAARAGAAEPDIVGGSPADAGEYPWMVALVTHGLPPAVGQFCGGSLIRLDLVLTAAHCVDGASANSIDVYAGSNDLTSGGEVIRAASITMHPDYDRNRTTSDLAVIRLQRASTLGTAGRVIRETQTGLWAPGDLAWVTGWGATSEGGAGSTTLLEAKVPIVSDATCQRAYGTSLAPKHHVCAGYVGEGGTDTCQGDSGGPMMVPNTRGQLFIMGLTSWGNGCARPRYPGVYTEVATYLDWIKAQLAS